jgi:hypothetical protein
LNFGVEVVAAEIKYLEITESLSTILAFTFDLGNL